MRHDIYEGVLFYIMKGIKPNYAELGNPRLGAALVSIDPQTGYIKAMVGGQDYSKSQYNIATSSNRQMGSSFKMYTH